MRIPFSLASVLCLLLASALPTPAQQNATLSFDALKDLELVGNYYAGGYGSLGSGPGPNYGIYFSATAEVLASKFSLGGGSGNFLNEPSPSNIVFFGGGGGLVMNVPAGFQNGLSLYYTGPLAGHLAVYSEVDSGGTLLATLALPALGSITPGVNDTFALVEAAFVGVAKSVNFSGAFNFLGFDNITLGLVTRCAGTLALEGVADLSATSPSAPLGTFHIAFRNPGETQEVYGSEVTLATTPGSGSGSFTTDAIAQGTYDVWIKGGKNLAVLLPNARVSGATFALGAVTLAAGDANGDNAVDVTDFGLFVSAYDSDSSVPGSGYEPAVDFNYDGVVDDMDLALLINEYGNIGSQ